MASAVVATLGRVKERMAAMGWQDGGSPGSVKLAPQGEVVANAGDATWVSDMQEACDHSERQAIIAELERRTVR